MAAGVKPRFDGKNPEGFANMHRVLPNKCLMFDIDRIYAQMDLSMRKEDEFFCEYNIVDSRIIFKALFEYKAHKTQNSEKALDSKCANSWARLEIARKLECRLFVVFAQNNRKPFDFYEIDLETGRPIHVGTLDYDVNEGKLAWNNFWANKLGLS